MNELCIYCIHVLHNSIIIEMAELEKPKLSRDLAYESPSQRMIININSNNTSFREHGQENRPKLYHALSSRRVQNAAQFTLSQLNVPTEPEKNGEKRSKRPSENQD
jgi:hypothetical protein